MEEERYLKVDAVGILTTISPVKRAQEVMPSATFGCEVNGNHTVENDAALKHRTCNSLKLIYFIMQPILIGLVCVAFPVERIQRETYNQALRVFGIYYKRFRCIQTQRL